MEQQYQHESNKKQIPNSQVYPEKCLQPISSREAL